MDNLGNSFLSQPALLQAGGWARGGVQSWKTELLHPLRRAPGAQAACVSSLWLDLESRTWVLAPLPVTQSLPPSRPDLTDWPAAGGSGNVC